MRFAPRTMTFATDPGTLRATRIAPGIYVYTFDQDPAHPIRYLAGATEAHAYAVGKGICATRQRNLRGTN